MERSKQLFIELFLTALRSRDAQPKVRNRRFRTKAIRESLSQPQSTFSGRCYCLLALSADNLPLASRKEIARARWIQWYALEINENYLSPFKPSVIIESWRATLWHIWAWITRIITRSQLCGSHRIPMPILWIWIKNRPDFHLSALPPAFGPLKTRPTLITFTQCNENSRQLFRSQFLAPRDSHTRSVPTDDVKTFDSKAHVVGKKSSQLNLNDCLTWPHLDEDVFHPWIVTFLPKWNVRRLNVSSLRDCKHWWLFNVENPIRDNSQKESDFHQQCPRIELDLDFGRARVRLNLT
jgi:hypothetical protein